MKFIPYYSGKQQGATFDTVKDCLLLQMQKIFRDGLYIVQELRDDKDDFGGIEPVRNVSVKSDPDENKREQDGFDIDYKEDRRTYNSKKENFESNQVKAYALIFEHCMSRNAQTLKQDSETIQEYY